MHKIYLKNILKLNLKQKKEILQIRNSIYVSSKMYTSHEITFDEHSNWIGNLEYNNQHLVFAIINENKILGALSLYNINFKNKKTEWSFYLTEKNIYGLGATLEFNFINYVFNKNNFEQLNCQVLETNFKIIKLHKKFFFKENNEKIKFIIKDKKKIKIIFMSLAATEWTEGRIFIENFYSRIINNFEINIDELNSTYLKN